MNAALCRGQTDTFQQAFEVLRARDNVEGAIAALSSGSGDVQPPCAHPTGNYAHCITVPDDIDETQFIAHPVVPADLTLGDLSGTPDYDLALGMISAMRDATEDCDSTIAMVTYPWLSEEDGTTPVTVGAVAKSFEAVAGFGDDLIMIWNTFSDDHATGGAQVVYDYSDSIANDELEFPGFPMNMPPMEGGFYDIDVAADSITYTLVDNRSATNILFPEGTFDRYYIIMPAPVESVEVVSSDSIVVEVDILEDGTEVETVDFFGTGLEFPESFGDNVIRVQIVGGTDLTELGQEIVLSYTLDQEMATFICASGPISEDPL